MSSSKFVFLSAYWFSVLGVFGGFTASVYEFFRQRNLGSDLVEAGLPIIVWLGTLVIWYFYARYTRNVSLLVSGFIGALILAASISAVLSRPDGFIVFLLWSIFAFAAAFVPRIQNLGQQ